MVLATVELVNVSNEELGFKDGATFAQTCDRAKRFGLDLCPAEVGSQPRLQDKDQPKVERFLMAVETIADWCGLLRIFPGSNAGGLWLRGRYGYPDDFWRGHHRFLFLRRR